MIRKTVVTLALLGLGIVACNDRSALDSGQGPLSPAYQRACQPDDFVYTDSICGPPVDGGGACGPNAGNDLCYKRCTRDSDCDEPTRPFCRALGLFSGGDYGCNDSVLVCREGRQNECDFGRPDDLRPDQPTDACPDLETEEECAADPGGEPVYVVEVTGEDPGGEPCFFETPPPEARRTYAGCAAPEPEVGLHAFWLANPEGSAPSCFYLDSNALVPTGWPRCNELLPLCP